MSDNNNPLFNQSLEKGLAVLRGFGAARRTMTLADIALVAGITRWFQLELARLNVDLRLGTAADAATIMDLRQRQFEQAPGKVAEQVAKAVVQHGEGFVAQRAQLADMGRRCGGRHMAFDEEGRAIGEGLGGKLRALCYEAFAVLHNGESKTPVYVVQRLNRAAIDDADEKRTNKFFADARLPRAERAELNDYKRSGYSRGHMAPAGDMPTAQAMAQSFSLANMVPQSIKQNGGPWARIEKDTRSYARTHVGRAAHDVEHGARADVDLAHIQAASRVFISTSSSSRCATRRAGSTAR